MDVGCSLKGSTASMIAYSGAPGGRIKTPRSLDPARRARTMETNHFDLAGLTDTGYHIGDDRVDPSMK
jgi:hypothetical protein